jgi:hypothetical protein
MQYALTIGGSIGFLFLVLGSLFLGGEQHLDLGIIEHEA